MKAVVMAGGFGSRLASLTEGIPKPMIKIGGKPVLEYEIEHLRDQGFRELILTVSYLGNVIMDYFGDGSAWNVSIQYYHEETPLGNAGALFKLRDQLTEDFFLLNADAIFDADLNRMAGFHRAHGALVTLFTHPNSHPYDSGLILAGADGAVQSWLAKEDARPQYYKNRVNAGIHIIHPKVLDMALEKLALPDGTPVTADMIGKADPTDPTGKKTVKIDLDRQILKPLAGTGRMYCYDSPEYVKDMGTPERFYAVTEDFLAGRIRRKNLQNPQKAIFLDRDGTINKYVGFLRRSEEFELLPKAAEAIRKINASGMLCIVATNQPVIARGEVTVPQLAEIHNKMETLLGLEGAYIDGLYYCPHHPHRGYEGEVPELKIDCNCRKPKPGMLQKAAEDFHIDLAASWMIGDGENDILAGIAAGCRTALIGEGEFGQNLRAANLLEAVERILSEEQ